MNELQTEQENKLQDEKKRFNPTLIIMAIIGISFLIFVVMAPPGKNTFSGPPQNGSPAPGFELKDLNDKTWSLESLKGTVVLMNFWAPWCGPCREEMPSLSDLFIRNRDSDDFQMLTILYQDTPDNAREYFAENGFEMPVLVDPRGKVSKLYGLAGIPETYVIDKNGVVRKHFIGPMDFASDDARQFIDGLMAEEEKPSTEEKPSSKQEQPSTKKEN